jgi:hypothetical protein
LLSELWSSQGSSVSVLNEHDKLTYDGVKPAYSCTLSETCRYVEVTEIKEVSYSSNFVFWGSRNRTREGQQIRSRAIMAAVLLLV